MRSSLPTLAGVPGSERLAAGLDALEQATAYLVAAEPALAAAGSAPYLALLGTVLGGWLLARLALAASERGGPPAAAKRATAQFYAEHCLAHAPSYLPAIRGGATIADFPPDWL